jgi:hypothetical protein
VHQLNLLAVALGQRPHLLRWLDVETIDQLASVREIDAAMHTSQEVERLLRRQLRPQRRLTRDIRDAFMRAHRIPPRIDTKQRRRSTRRAMQTEQTTNRRRLPGTVRAQEAVDLPSSDDQVKIGQRECLAVPLRQPGRHDGITHR